MAYPLLNASCPAHLLLLGVFLCVLPKVFPYTPIVACSSSIELERAFAFYCQPGDKVLEVGAHFSKASHQLCTAIAPGGQASLVDIIRSEAKSGRSTIRDIENFRSREGVNIVELPSLDDWKDFIFSESSSQKCPPSFDVISIDIGHMIGNDLYLSTLSLANEMLSIAKPRVMIVKSQSLSSLARRLIPAQHVFDGIASMPAPQQEIKAGNGALREAVSCSILASVGVEEYRRLIPATVTNGDVVLEVGCHFGRTTRLLNEAAQSQDNGGYCIGVDIGPKIIKSAQSQCPSITFAVADAWKTLDLLKLRQDGVLGYDVVYADIGGLSGPHGTLEALALLDALANALEPRCIVIKSLCMKRLASRLRSFQSIWATRGSATLQ